MKVLADKKDFDATYSNLDRNSTIFKDVQSVINNLKNNVLVGERIQFGKIPKYYKTRHGIDNAFHVYLPEGMRLIYSIAIYRGEKTAFLIELADHKTYEQRFKY
jgi:hypothetical protein